MSHDLPQQSAELDEAIQPLFSYLDGVIWEADPETFRFTFVSNQVERLLGFPRERWLEPGFWLDHLHPEDRSWAPEFCIRTTRELRSHEFEYRMVAADGRIVWIQDRVTVVVRDGVVVKLCGILLDVSKAKQAELELREAQWQLETAQRSTGSGSFVYELDTGNIKCSPHLLLILGKQAGTPVSVDSFLADLLPGDHVSLTELLNDFPWKDDLACFDFAYRIPSGETRYFLSVLQIERDSNHAVSRVFGSVQDVTDRKLVEIERKESHRFLEAMDRVNRAALSVNNLDQMLAAVFDQILDVLNCDRVWISRPSPLQPFRWQVEMELMRPRATMAVLPRFMPECVNSSLSAAILSEAPFRLPMWEEENWPQSLQEHFQSRENLCAAIHVRMASPYVLGLQHRSVDHVWTAAEYRLVQSICRRLADALSSLLAHQSLAASESNLAEAQRLTHLGYWRRDFVNQTFTSSEETYRILGVDPKEYSNVLGECDRAFDDVIHEEDRARVNEAAADALAGRKEYDVEYRILRPDGEVRHVHSRGKVERDDQGKPLRWLGTIQDITELRRAEFELQASATRFRQYLDYATISIVLSDENGRIFDVNRQACLNLGYSRDELIGMSLQDIDARLSRKDIRQFEARLQSGEIVSFESRHRRKDGSEFPVELRLGSVIQDGQRHSVSIALDITEREQSQRQLKQSHELMRAIIEGTSDAIYVKDVDGRYMMINSAGAELFGLRVEDILLRTDSELPATDAARVLMTTMDQNEYTNASQLCEETIQVNGENRTYLSARYSYFDQAGSAIGRIGISRDITEMQRLSDALRHSQKMEAIGRLAGGIAHDFNNLLTVIISYSELLLIGLESDAVKLKQVSEINKCAVRAASLTRQLLAFSRKQKLHAERLDLRSCFDELRGMLQPIIGEDIELTLVASDTVGEVIMDRDQFLQAITNLAINARDAMPGGGELSISATDYWYHSNSTQVQYPNLKPGRYALVSVSDSGVGIPDAVRGRIFEPFFTTKPLGKGTGLGLAMIYGFVIQSGGYVDVSSEEGRGSTFRLYLPCAQAADMSSSREIIGAGEVTYSEGHETILLVEDEESVRSLCRHILEARGYRVLQAKDGVEAYEIFQGNRGKIDLLLTDVVMPRMNGPKLLAAIHNDSPHLPALFISGYADDIVLRDLPNHRMNLLRKPFSPVQLTERIQQTLQMAKIAKQDV